MHVVETPGCISASRKSSWIIPVTPSNRLIPEIQLELEMEHEAGDIVKAAETQLDG